MKKVVIFLCICLFSLNLLAEKKGELQFSKKDIDTYKNQATQLLSFLEYSMNAVGSSASTQKEKEIIINESFLKIFKNVDVQVEDDLDELRTVPTNKGIQAYLKDIDFFFKDVQFKFTIQDVSHHIGESNYLFFKFKINRNLRAKFFNGDTINTNKIRFIEINVDDEKQDLKIASIYTTKLNENEELQNWWNTMPKAWKQFFGTERSLNDSIQLSDIINFSDSFFVVSNDTNLLVEIDTFLAFSQDTIYINELDTVRSTFNDTILFNPEQMYQILAELVSLEEIKIPDSLKIRDLSPLSKLTKLRSLSIAKSPVESLIPIRNLTNLEVLECQGTQVKTLTALRYSTNLRSLDISNTTIWDLAPVANFSLLERLYFNHTPIDDLLPLSKLENLQDLRFANSNIINIDSLKSLHNLVILNFSSTNVHSIEALSGLKKLRMLIIDSTQIKDLSPLENNTQLLKVYCDFSQIKLKEANRFMLTNPNCMVIFESEELSGWWNELDEAWKQAFRNDNALDIIPTTEQLHNLPKTKSLNISNQSGITTLEPLRKLIGLEHLNCNNTGVSELNPLSDLIDLKYLDARQTNVKNLFPIKNLNKLEFLYLSNTNVSELMFLGELNDLHELHIENTNISSLDAVSKLSQLKIIYADDSKIELDEVQNFKTKMKECLVLFRTRELRAWWRNLSKEWEKVFRETTQIYSDPLSPEDLHRISSIEKIDISNNLEIKNLNPLTTLSWLKELRFSGTRITQLYALRKIKSLELIECANNPISDLSDIMLLPNLKRLDISNIPIKDFEQIQNLKNLEILICPGTQIKNLKYLETMSKLKHLEIYNTKVKNISPIEALNLVLLKCYNTNINSKKIEAFKLQHKECEVVFY